jgi:ankyrin repeat protein
LEGGASPNADGAGYTALHWAAGAWESDLTGPTGVLRAAVDEEWSAFAGPRGDRLEWVQLLLAYGADPNIRLRNRPHLVGYTKSRNAYTGEYFLNLLGATPFLLAARAGDARVMRALLERGADPRVGTTDHTTPLMVAAGLGRLSSESDVTEASALECVKLALESGIAINGVNDAGETALHGAASARANTVVQFLIDRGARVNANNRRGETPLVYAERTLQYAGYEFYVPEHTSTGDLLRQVGAR